MTKFEKNELLALIKDYGNLNIIYNNAETESDSFGTCFWEMKDMLFDKIKTLIDNISINQ